MGAVEVPFIIFIRSVVIIGVIRKRVRGTERDDKTLGVGAEETDRQTDRQASRQTGRQADRQRIILRKRKRHGTVSLISFYSVLVVGMSCKQDRINRAFFSCSPVSAHF